MVNKLNAPKISRLCFWYFHFNLLQINTHLEMKTRLSYVSCILILVSLLTTGCARNHGLGHHGERTPAWAREERSADRFRNKRPQQPSFKVAQVRGARAVSPKAKVGGIDWGGSAERNRRSFASKFEFWSETAVVIANNVYLFVLKLYSKKNIYKIPFEVAWKC